MENIEKVSDKSCQGETDNADICDDLAIILP